MWWRAVNEEGLDDVDGFEDSPARSYEYLTGCQLTWQRIEALLRKKLIYCSHNKTLLLLIVSCFLLFIFRSLVDEKEEVDSCPKETTCFWWEKLFFESVSFDHLSARRWMAITVSTFVAADSTVLLLNPSAPALFSRYILPSCIFMHVSSQGCSPESINT